jgi:hypothetical protein
VQVRVHKRESEKAKEIRRSSHAYMKEQEDKEAWKTVTMFNPESEEAQAVKEHLISKTSNPIDFSVSQKDYLNSLNAVSNSRDDGCVPAQTQELSREKLETMELPEQVTALMRAAQALHFSRLLELVPNGTHHADQVLELLPDVAVLVQGCWVATSELVYKEEGRSSTVVDSLRRARDHVLSHFHVNTRLIASSLRKEITKEVRHSPLCGEHVYVCACVWIYMYNVSGNRQPQA